MEGGTGLMIYMDHSATTPVDPHVVEAMLPYWTESYGNPSSVYGLGRRAAAALEDSRRRVAALLNCQPAEIIFTSCGTESDNLAIRSASMLQAERGRRHIITTAIEHHAVLHTVAEMVERYDCEATYLPLDSTGRVDPASVEAAIRQDTGLISIMYANNEIGTIEPIAEIGAVAHRHGIPFHTDAVQAGGFLSLDVEELGVDFLALSAHKFYGPKGVGMLYVRRGMPLRALQTGGSQERGRRAGTENVAYIVGQACALELAHSQRASESTQLTGLRDRLIEGLLGRIPEMTLSGHPEQRLPGHASFIVRGVEAEGMLIGLDLAGIAASSGSACASGSPTPSHVLTALGVSHVDALGALRLSLGRSTTENDVSHVLATLPPLVERLRAMDGAQGAEQ